ncbi:MAG: hypothetical protein O2973_03505 [Gemmatimonadetes bacterium]|nr:hypothetical protein [Gemmatimonadota bacterium]
MKDAKTQESRYRSAGIPGAAPLVPVADEPGGMARSAGRAFASWCKTAAVTLGVMYVLGWGALTFGVVGLNRMTARPPNMGNTIQKNIIAEVMRPYALPVDPTISPERAGLAFVTMQPPERASADFPRRTVDSRPEIPWRDMTIAPGLFPTARPNAYRGPSSQGLLTAAA